MATEQRIQPPVQINPDMWTETLSALTPAPGMLRLWTSTMGSMWMMGLTAQQVICLRLSRLASEGATAANQREVQQMVSEKVAAVTESANSLVKAGTAFVSAAPGALTDPKRAQGLATSTLRSANRAIRPFSTRVKANHKRLSAG